MQQMAQEPPPHWAAVKEFGAPRPDADRSAPLMPGAASEVGVLGQPATPMAGNLVAATSSSTPESDGNNMLMMPCKAPKKSQPPVCPPPCLQDEARGTSRGRNGAARLS